MSNPNKYITSSIIIKYGFLQKLPKNFEYSTGISVIFDLVEENIFQITFDFDKVRLSNEECYIFAKKETIKLGYWIALNNKYHVGSLLCHTISLDRFSRKNIGMIISGKDKIVFAENPRSMFNESLNKYELALKCYNQALYSKESGERDNEIAFWIYYSLEALMIGLYNKTDINQLREDLVNAHVCSSPHFNTFQYSIGKYYRHCEIKCKTTVFDIKKCLKIYINILNCIVSGKI